MRPGECIINGDCQDDPERLHGLQDYEASMQSTPPLPSPTHTAKKRCTTACTSGLGNGCLRLHIYVDAYIHISLYMYCISLSSLSSLSLSLLCVCLCLYLSIILHVVKLHPEAGVCVQVCVRVSDTQTYSHTHTHIHTHAHIHTQGYASHASGHLPARCVHGRERDIDEE